MGLAKYFKKRRFNETPEPKGAPKHSSGKKLVFVVHEHHASTLHYDLRLELDGVLKSWAIPKGPSMDPHQHHLAVQTEDHPYDYRNFEGVIPEGNYGAGPTIIWDEGTYEPRADTADPQKTLRKELKKGHLTFVLQGHKLRGEFALIRLQKAEQKNAWLLIKKGDQFASTKDITKQDESIKSHKTVDELDTNKIAPKQLESYPKRANPWRVLPMLCTLVDEPFSRPGWLFEVKWDGYRAVAAKKDDSVTLLSRNQLNFAEHYPPVYEAVRNLKHNVILDGEIVAVDKDGRPHFELLQHWRTAHAGDLLYYVFDILWCDGFDVRTMPLLERKKLLKKVVPKSGVIRYSDHVETEGLKLFDAMQKQGLEGVVAKRADSPYREDVRGDEWLKIKTSLRQEVVIGGFTEPRGGRKHLGALIVGVYHKGQLQYVGHSGGGFSDEERKTLRERLNRLERSTSPFVTEPKPNAPVHWVRPELVCEMAFSEWTSEGSMRHPRFVGLRPDKSPKNVVRETMHKTRKVSK